MQCSSQRQRQKLCYSLEAIHQIRIVTNHASYWVEHGNYPGSSQTRCALQKSCRTHGASTALRLCMRDVSMANAWVGWPKCCVARCPSGCVRHIFRIILLKKLVSLLIARRVLQVANMHVLMHACWKSASLWCYNTVVVRNIMLSFQQTSTANSKVVQKKTDQKKVTHSQWLFMSP